MITAVREPAVAGYFYPRSPQALSRDISGYTAQAGDKFSALACVVPHAGYMYSGHVAGAVYGRLELPRRFVILCPNHTGFGRPLAIMTEGAWQTPLGQAQIDHALAGLLRVACPLLEEDDVAHKGEHAIEVQLPFLQSALPEFTFVPIAVGTSRYEPLQALGKAMAGVLRDQSEKVMLIASSDMNHYEPDDVTRVKDRKAIDQILALDPRGLYDVVMQESISMCGFGPTVAVVTAARLLGAKSAAVIKYATSADISGDRSAVVGYAGLVIQ
ncbi:MAG TPA: AmmeMemoRadiSam system protein B [Terriglobales bacterium]|nr:AmmeMemoRadiSam system protein B [Terriglobales bacterium]